jgi:hypothetical protein
MSWDRSYPQTRFHAGLPPRQVLSVEEDFALGEGWFDNQQVADEWALENPELASRTAPASAVAVESQPAENSPQNSPEPVFTVEAGTSPFSGTYAPSALTNEEPPLAHASVDDVD